MLKTMLQKTLTILMTEPYLAITDSEKYYTHPIHTDIMKCCVSKGYFCSQLGLFPLQGHTECALALQFNNDNAKKTFSSILANPITKNLITPYT